MVLQQILQNGWMAFGVGVLLLWIIHRSFNPGFGWILGIGIVLLVAWHYRGWVMGELQIDLPSGQAFSVQVPKQGIGTAPNPVPAVQAQTVVGTTPPVSKPQVKRIAVKKHKSVNQALETPAKTVVVSNPTPVAAASYESATAKQPMEADKDFVLNFAQALYSIGYQNYQDRETTLLGWVTKDYAGDLKGHYFNPYILKNMEGIHRTKAFTPDAPVKWISSNETAEEFMISGTIVGQGGWNGQSSNFTKTVKAKIQIIHDPQGKCLVKKIGETITE